MRAVFERADALCKPSQREEVLVLYNLVESDPAFRLIRAPRERIQRGRQLYSERPDKDWSLTDCLSFVVMQDEGLADALTGDNHFEQAGFRALLS